MEQIEMGYSSKAEGVWEGLKPWLRHPLGAYNPANCCLLDILTYINPSGDMNAPNKTSPSKTYFLYAQPSFRVQVITQGELSAPLTPLPTAITEDKKDTHISHRVRFHEQGFTPPEKIETDPTCVI